MIPAIIPPTVVTTMPLLKKKVLKCLWVMKYVDIGLLRPDTLPLVITEVMGIGLLIPATLPILIAEDIMAVMLIYVDLCHSITYNIPCEIMEQ